MKIFQTLGSFVGKFFRHKKSVDSTCETVWKAVQQETLWVEVQHFLPRMGRGALRIKIAKRLANTHVGIVYMRQDVPGNVLELIDCTLIGTDKGIIVWFTNGDVGSWRVRLGPYSIQPLGENEDLCAKQILAVCQRVCTVS